MSSPTDFQNTEADEKSRVNRTRQNEPPAFSVLMCVAHAEGMGVPKRQRSSGPTENPVWPMAQRQTV